MAAGDGLNSSNQNSKAKSIIDKLLSGAIGMQKATVHHAVTNLADNKMSLIHNCFKTVFTWDVNF